MNNPRDNRTTGERAMWSQHGYTLALDLIDALGRPSRFWFRDPTDRQAFADLFNRLRDCYGHTTSAVIR